MFGCREPKKVVFRKSWYAHGQLKRYALYLFRPSSQENMNSMSQQKNSEGMTSKNVENNYVVTDLFPPKIYPNKFKHFYKNGSNDFNKTGVINRPFFSRGQKSFRTSHWIRPMLACGDSTKKPTSLLLLLLSPCYYTLRLSFKVRGLLSSQLIRTSSDFLSSASHLFPSSALCR